MNKPKLNDPRVLRLIHQRKKFREAAILTALDLVTWPVSKPGREQVERLMQVRLRHLRRVFRSPYDEIVINVIQRRALTVYHQRQQQENQS